MNATFCGASALSDHTGMNASVSNSTADLPRVCLALLPPDTPYSPIVTTLLVALMSPVICIIVVGNSLVIYACLTDSKLRRPHHWFLVSLAVSDLTVGLLVMPFALVNEYLGQGKLNYARLQSSTRVGGLIVAVLNYARLQSSTRVGGLILAVWVLALTVCLPPLMGWGKEHGVGDGMCGLSSFFPYVVLSSTLSFFIPLVVMATLYAMILNSHRSRNNWRRKLGKGYSCSTVTNNTFKSRNLSAEDGEMSPTRKEMGSPMRQCAAQRRERRFVFIIGVVMVTFTLCWLPFFTFYLLCVLWWQCFPRWLFVLSVWLGYCNSALNPFIYAIWNDTIREAFKKALCSKAPGHATP
ncbi:PREDICTED: alpha-2B adrenergic receptor-like [Branchiostoma belcheri]|uniref:Alpha-2B adrenergic receptor-like n=1 Tax=Branchiostoma belcheri TaxID=7741 RepID=A0A6P5A4S6_BRABE|nr:PREDICTED: alpha-2B adrenergic receptor-like [Branchiostoma belcheri]